MLHAALTAIIACNKCSALQQQWPRSHAHTRAENTHTATFTRRDTTNAQVFQTVVAPRRCCCCCRAAVDVAAAAAAAATANVAAAGVAAACRCCRGRRCCLLLVCGKEEKTQNRKMSHVSLRFSLDNSIALLRRPTSLARCRNITQSIKLTYRTLRHVTLPYVTTKTCPLP